MFPLFGLVHRMIFWELLKVFVLSLVSLTGLFLMAGLIQQASQMGLSPGRVLRVIPLLIPYSLLWTVPATTLFASCVVYGRLANDNEVVVLKAAGVDVLTTLRPAVLLGVIAMLVTGAMNYAFIPWTQQQLRAEVLKDPEEVLYNIIKRERRYSQPSSLYSLHVDDVRGRRLIDVVVKRKAAVQLVAGGGARVEYDYIARAREARLIVNLETRKLTVDAERWVVANATSTAESQNQPPFEIDLPEMFSDKQIKSHVQALEWDDLPARARELEGKRDEAEAKRAANLREAQTTADPKKAQALFDQDPHYERQVKEAARNVRLIEYERHLRPALAVGCLCFAVVGCPVGIRASRADYLSVFVICFLPAVAVYYPVLFAGGGLAKDAKVPMAVGVWAADAVIGLAAVVLTFRLIRR